MHRRLGVGQHLRASIGCALARLSSHVVLLALAALGLGLAAGCSPTPATPETPTLTPGGSPAATSSPTATAPPATATISPERLSEVIEAGADVPSVFNPLLPEAAPAQRVIDNLFDTLLTVDAETGQVTPHLASGWDISTDNLMVTFHLRSDVVWHDSEPFTADDVAFTFEAIHQAGVSAVLKARLNAVTGVSSPDSQTLVVSFSRSACSLLPDIGQIPILPGHLLRGQELTDAKFNTEAPIGTGPFRFKALSSSGDVELLRNDKYFLGSPHFSAWVYRRISDTAALPADLNAGAVDVAELSPAQTAQLEPPSRLLTYQKPEYYAIVLNTAQSPLVDVAIRQALSCAIDRDKLVSEVLGGRGTVIDGPILPGHWAYSVPEDLHHYDPAQAQQLLTEAGWTDANHDGIREKNGVPLRIGLSVNGENPIRTAIAARVQRDWLSVGVAAEVQTVEYAVLVERLFGHNFGAAVFSWPVHPDPDQTRLWASDENAMWSGFNFASYSNTVQVDAALYAGLVAEACNPKDRASAYAEVLSALAADQPYIYLFVPNAYLATSARLEGVRPGPYASLSWNIWQWQARP